MVDCEYVAVFAAFAIMLYFSVIPSVGGGKNASSSIKYDTCTALKALCCIVIICHHYALRTQGELLDKALGFGGGTFALSIFLMLSAYGITRSEISKPTTVTQYARKRLWKLLLPYLVVTVATLVAYWLVGGYDSAENLRIARVNSSFAWIGQHLATLMDFIYYVIGVKSLDGAMWFVGVTVFSYIAFLLSKQLILPHHSLMEKRGAVFGAYVTLILLFAAFTYWQNFPAHYYRNLWALAVGMAVALWEKELMRLSIKKKLVLYAVGNALVWGWLLVTSSADWVYLFFANIAVALILLFNYFFKRYRLKSRSPIVWLSAVSYMIYLVHGKVLTLQWWYTGYNSAVVAVAASILLAWCFSLFMRHVFRQN